MMNCEDCRQHLLDYAYGELSPKLETEVSAALANCAECQKELAQIHGTRSAFAEAMPAEAPPAQLHANIMREARLEAYSVKESAATSVIESIRQWLMHPAFASVAAILLVSLGIFFVLSDNQLRPDSPVFGEKASPKRASADLSAVKEVEAEDGEAPEEESVVDSLAEPAATAAPGPGDQKADRASPPPAKASGDVASKGAKMERKAARATAPAQKDEFAAQQPKKEKVAPKKSPKMLGDLDGLRTRGMPRVQDEDPATNSGVGGAGGLDDDVANAPAREGNSKPALPEFDSNPSLAEELSSDNDNDIAEGSGVQGGANQSYERGMERYNRGEWSGAIIEFNSVIKSGPSGSKYYAMAVFHKGRSLYNQGAYSGAVVQFRRVVRGSPSSKYSSEARYYLANSLLKIDPNSIEAKRILASLSKGSGGVADRARKDFARTYGRRPPPEGRQKKKMQKSKSSTFDFEEGEAGEVFLP